MVPVYGSEKLFDCFGTRARAALDLLHAQDDCSAQLFSHYMRTASKA